MILGAIAFFFGRRTSIQSTQVIPSVSATLPMTRPAEGTPEIKRPAPRTADPEPPAVPRSPSLPEPSGRYVPETKKANTLACGDQYQPLPAGRGTWELEVPTGGCSTNILILPDSFPTIELRRFTNDMNVELLWKGYGSSEVQKLRFSWGPTRGTLEFSGMSNIFGPGPRPITVTGLRFDNPTQQGPVGVELQLR